MAREPLFSDTDEKTEQVLLDLVRAMPAWKKFQQIAGAAETCRAFALAGLRSRYPDATEAEIRRRLAAVVLDRESVIKAYGWDPEKEGY